MLSGYLRARVLYSLRQSNHLSINMVGTEILRKVVMEVDLIIFDMGGVVCEDTAVLPYILRELNLSKQDFYKHAGDLVERLQTGSITPAVFWEQFAVGYGRMVEEDLWKTLFKPRRNEETVKAIRDLKQRYRVIAGTNTILPHYEVHFANGDYAVFDHVYASHEMGVAKPDVEFYRQILQAENCEAAKVVFIDDNEGNVEAAKGIGIQAIRFITAAALCEELQKLGVL